MKGKILYVVPGWFTLYYHLRGHLSYMRSQGFDVEVACEPDPRAREAAEREGATFHTVSVRPNQFSFKDIGLFWEILRIVKRGRYHVIYCCTKKGSLLSVLAGRLSGVCGVVYHIRGTRWVSDLPEMSSKLMTQVEKWNCFLASKAVFVSNSNRSLYLDKKICAENKAVVIGAGSSDGVDSQRFQMTDEVLAGAKALKEALHIPSDAYVIGFVGRAVFEKGIKDLVEAWRRIREACPNAHLLMLAPPETDSPDAVSVLQEDPRAHFAGFMANPVPGYAAMNCVVIPSRVSEGFAMVAMEAGAMEVPVIATAVKGSGMLDAVVHEKTGLLVKPNDPQALYEALLYLVSNKELGRNMGKNGRKRCIEEFGQQLNWQGFADIYRNLIGPLNPTST